MDALTLIKNTIDPQADEPYAPLTPADQCETDGLVYEEYISPTDTVYMIGRDPNTGEVVRDDRPWQLRLT